MHDDTLVSYSIYESLFVVGTLTTQFFPLEITVILNFGISI